MTHITRELVVSVLAAVGLVGLSVWGMPWWLATLLAIGFYGGLRTVIPARPALSDSAQTDGVTAAECREVIQQGRHCVATMRQLVLHLRSLHPAFGSRVEELCRTVDAILQRFEREPHDIRLAGPFPAYLTRLTGMLQTYVSLWPQDHADTALQQSLTLTEEVVARAIPVFQELHRKLLAGTRLALETEAETLKVLLEELDLR
jgi:hypothetical protein